MRLAYDSYWRPSMWRRRLLSLVGISQVIIVPRGRYMSVPDWKRTTEIEQIREERRIAPARAVSWWEDVV